MKRTSLSFNKSTDRNVRAKIGDMVQFIEQLATDAEESERLKKVNSDLHSQVEDSKRQIEAKNQEILDAATDVEYLNDHVDALKQTIEVKNKSLQTKEQEIIDATVKNIQLEGRITSMQSELQAKDQEITNHTIKITALQSELNRADETIMSAQSHFTDCITLVTSASCIPTTTGQLISIEALVKVWIHDTRFNGDIFYPYICPLTKQTTSPIKDLRTIEILTRIGDSLGLQSDTPFHFRYKINGDWEVYSVIDQLSIMSKLVLSYHRHSSFTVCVKDCHFISGIHTITNDIQTFSLNMYVISNTGEPTKNSIELHFESGAYNPFHRCMFV